MQNGSYDVVILLGTLLILSATGLMIWRIIAQVKKKRAKDSEYSIGDYINETLLKEQSTFVIFVLVTINIAEGVLSASIHPPHEEQINPISRFLTHVSISLVGIIAAVNFAKAVIEVFKHGVFVSEKAMRKRPLMWIYLGVLITIAATIGWLAVFLPFLNLSVIATGLGQMELADLAFITTFTFGGDIDYTQYGYAPDFDPFAQMSFQMRASWLLVLCHYALGVYDSLLAARTYIRDKVFTTASLNEKITQKGTTKQDLEDIKEDATDVFDLALTFLNYRGKEAKVESLIKAFNRLDTAKQNRIAGKLAGYRNRIIAFEDEAETSSDPIALKKKRKILRNDLFDFFAKPVAEGGMAQALSRTAVGKGDEGDEEEEDLE